jgi:2-polyprenyl-6-methoxyphenol hydroxylase-like FAD-dependent oxidoreductase
VALVERESRPDAYKKVCTHVIESSATPTLQRLGIAERMEAAGAVRNAIQLWTRWGWVRPKLDDGYQFPRYGYNLRRQKLDPILRTMAAGTPGVTFMPGQASRGLLLNGTRIEGVEVQTADGEQHAITARLVVAADGRNSSLAGFAAVPAKVKPNNRFGYFAYYAGLPLASGTESQMWLLEPDVAYAFPNDDDLTVLAVYIDKPKLAAWRSDLEGSFTAVFERLPDGPDIHAARRVSPFLGILEAPNTERPTVFRGMALVGDAALFSDPLWGVGCGWAFQSAEWLVDATANALLARIDLEPALRAYAKRHRAGLAGHHFLISDYSTGRALNPIERLMFSAAAKEKRMANHLAAYGTRNIGATQFLSPTALVRALLANLRRRN